MSFSLHPSNDRFGDCLAKRIRTNFDDEFKRKAATLAEKLGSQKLAAQKLNVSEVNIHNWVKRFYGDRSIKKVDPKPTKKQSTVAALKERIDYLEKDNTMLRQIVASLSLDYVGEKSGKS